MTCMIFIIGYVFGNFSKRKTLATISKVASILLIVLFIFSNAISMRFVGWRGVGKTQYDQCNRLRTDSTTIKKHD